MTVILALRKKRQEDRKFEAMLGYIETVLKNNKKKHNLKKLCNKNKKFLLPPSTDSNKGNLSVC
jgi:hypothetical protein